MLAMLQTGHSSNCGWTNNFCSEDFIAFPMKSSESMCEEFLLRFRSLVLAVAEFARKSCNTADSHQIVDAQSTLSSSSKVINPACIRLIVGGAIFKSVPKLSQWIFDGTSSSTVDDNENKDNTIEIQIHPVSFSACRSRLAAAVEATDTQLLRFKNFNNLSSSSGVQPLLSQLSGYMETHRPETSGSDVAANSDSDIVIAETVSQQVIKMCVLLAVSGWVPTSSKASFQPETAADTPVSATIPSRELGSATALISVSTSNIGADCLRCDWCGRSFPLKYLMTARVDPLMQHRAFCQWGHYSDNEQVCNFTEKTPGWLQCAEAVVDCRGGPLDSSSGRKDGRNIPNRRFSAIVAESDLLSDSSHDATRHCEEQLIDSAEQAYKKIKLVLDSATLPRLSLGSRRSI